MVTIGELYANVKSMLKKVDIDTYRFESKCIMEHAFKIELPRLLLNADSAAPDEIVKFVHSMVNKRSTGYPLQYILGEWVFYGLPFKVGEGVLIPRPDTETIIDTVLKKYNADKNSSPRIADLCSGSGCIAVTLKKEIPDAHVTAIEVSDTALEYLKENAELNGADIEIIKGDVLDESLAEKLEQFDIIVSNPPYLSKNDMDNLQTEVSFEPQSALDGGQDGLEYYRKMTSIWKNKIKPGGLFFYEIGIGQGEEVKEIFLENGFENTEFSRDTADIIRIVSAYRKQED